MRGEIEKVAAFLGRSLTEDELVKLTDHLRFDKMKQNETNFAPKKEDKGDLHFVRKGKMSITYISNSAIETIFFSM